MKKKSNRKKKKKNPNNLIPEGMERDGRSVVSQFVDSHKRKKKTIVLTARAGRGADFALGSASWPR